jgi:hypothetical protein
VGVGQGYGQGRRVRQVPRTVRATRCLGGKVSIYAPLTQLCESRSPLLPLLPLYRPKAAPEPFLEFIQRGGEFAVAK